MDESHSPAAGAGELDQNRSHAKSQAQIVGVHPLYLLLPRQIPSLLPFMRSYTSASAAGDIPVTGEPEGTSYTSRFVTPYIRQNRASTAGSLPPMVLDPLLGVQSTRAVQ